MKRALAAMDRRPWTLAFFAALGTTLLVCGALPLAAPPELLDALVAAGDARLSLALLGVFACGLAVFRVLLRRRKLPEEELDEPAPPRPVSRPPPEAEPARNGGYLR